MYKCYLPDKSKQISIVNFCRREEILSVTFDILNEEAAAISRDDVIGMHRLLNEILSTFLKSDTIKLKQAVRPVVQTAERHNMPPPLQVVTCSVTQSGLVIF